MRVALSIGTLLLATMAAETPTTSRVLPAGQSISKAVDNLYFQRGLQASTEGLKTLSVTIKAQPSDSLTERINLSHLGLGMSGWTFVAQSSIDADGTTQQVLLTYKR